MKASKIKPNMVFEDCDRQFVLVKKWVSIAGSAGFEVEMLDLLCDLTFERTGDTYFETEFAMERFYDYIGEWEDENAKAD